jgi:hypothetical protein
MKIGIMLYRFGILGLLFAPGVLLEDPLKTYLAQNHQALTTYILLYGLPTLVGFTMLIMSEEGFRSPPPAFARLLNALSLLTIFWLLLWCFIWAGLGPKAGNPSDPFVKYILYFGFLGTAVGAGCYGWAWKLSSVAKRTAWCLIAIGWNISFMAFLNLHLDPAMGHLKGPGFGGLLVMAGVSLILREI